MHLIIVYLVEEAGYERRHWSKIKTTMGQLHDDVMLLQLPESLSLLFSYAN